ncbi:unnamed protein product [Microthlaspi erraticum]|uniref:F-box associated beta-propeller type 3 domain-containing protein n=1 Tax=Microthlaspi erraticum TaxID=1685480 RepID=A0A6D2HZX4_9BRAS|nr:unnamed protein product [Microthlaspi erraticum]
MTKRKQQVSLDDNVSGGNKRSSASVGGETNYIDLIPIDVFNDIFSRLQLKYKARCYCVSKHWSSKLPAPPRLLFAFNVGSNLFFYYSPQRHDMDAGSFLGATPHRMDLGTSFYKLCRPLRGLVCSQHVRNKYSWAVISNPITGEYVTTTKVSLNGGSGWTTGKAEYSLGYDPIDKQFKVLRTTWWSNPNNLYATYHVLTLETGKKYLSWRRIHCCTPHSPIEDKDNDKGICINGVLYYPSISHKEKLTIVCFDVRTEKFSFTDIDQGMVGRLHRRPFNLINYKGKLGVTEGHAIYPPSIELWVLEDADKHKWLKHVFNWDLPHQSLIGENHVCLAGMNGSEEFVLSPIHTRDPFFIYYYNLETNTPKKVGVEVPVVDESKSCRVYTFPNFVEEVKLI